MTRAVSYRFFTSKTDKPAPCVWAAEVGAGLLYRSYIWYSALDKISLTFRWHLDCVLLPEVLTGEQLSPPLKTTLLSLPHGFSRLVLAVNHRGLLSEKQDCFTLLFWWGLVRWRGIIGVVPFFVSGTAKATRFLKVLHQGHQWDSCLINVKINLWVYPFVIILSSPSGGPHTEFWGSSA